MKARSTGGEHHWAFARTGGVDQVLLRDGRDILRLPGLDQKLWGALAMPRKAAGGGPRSPTPRDRSVLPETLAALDREDAGRIRVPDISAAVGLCGEHLKDLDPFVTPGETIRLDNLKPGPVADAARWALTAKPASREISLADARAGQAGLSGHRLNGDGVVPPDSAADERVRAQLTDIVSAGYGEPDLSGAAGVSKKGLSAFLADAKAWLEWVREPHSRGELAPLGEATGEAWVATEAIRAKLDDWFLRSSLAALSVAPAALWGQDERLSALLGGGIRPDTPELVALPLAVPSPGGVLPLDGPVNPAWAPALRRFAAAVRPIAAPAERGLDAGAWARIQAALAPYGAWLGARPAGGAGSLGEDRVTTILAEGTTALEALIDEDTGWAQKRRHLEDLVRILLYRRDLVRVLRNFVNFSDFYGERDAMFQAGRLYVDGRECDLCIEVDNPGAHATLAVMSGVYLIYCDVTRKDGGRKAIAAALTAGEPGNLFVGKNGVFYDREGRDWDARITRIQVQPISIREAFFSPYRWLVRTIEDLVAKRAAAAESGQLEKLKGKAETAVNTLASPTTAAPSAVAPKKIDVGTVAAIGVALGSIGAMVTGVISAFVGMGVWMPVGLVSIFLLISGPSMLLAYLKLRRRNLGPILDAEGWAINGRLKINMAFGGALTRLAALPPGSERRLTDPFAAKRRPWGLYLVLLVIVAAAVLWVTRVLDPILPAAIRMGTLLGGP